MIARSLLFSVVKMHSLRLSPFAPTHLLFIVRVHVLRDELLVEEGGEEGRVEGWLQQGGDEVHPRLHGQHQPGLQCGHPHSIVHVETLSVC